MKKNTPINSIPIRRLTYFTPLRYPGGKAKLAPFVKKIIEENNLVDGQYVEPYAGGSGIALELLFHEYVSHIYLNDVSRPVYSFWKSVLDYTESLIKLIHKTKPTVSEWDRQKKIFSNPEDYDDLKLGFATFFLNRTNRSGILNGGIIGGRDQSGSWKIDARYNAPELIFRIESIANIRKRISISCNDAVSFLSTRLRLFPKNTLIYLDPPYYFKGKDLYYDFYTHQDHEKIAQFVVNKIINQKWIVSYDNVEPIHIMYRGYQNVVYELGYSANEARLGSEIIFFSKNLYVPETIGEIKAIA
jgi:DNA adenine methylase